MSLDKHLGGAHDQQSHGKWSDPSRTQSESRGNDDKDLRAMDAMDLLHHSPKRQLSNRERMMVARLTSEFTDATTRPRGGVEFARTWLRPNEPRVTGYVPKVNEK